MSDGEALPLGSDVPAPSPFSGVLDAPGRILGGTRPVVPIPAALPPEGDADPTLVTFGLTAGLFKTRLVTRLNEDTNDLVSFRMFSESSGLFTIPSFSFYSKEGADPDGPFNFASARAPKLTVTIEELNVIPVPVALPLLLSGLAGLGLIGWRKRKAA